MTTNTKVESDLPKERYFCLINNNGSCGKRFVGNTPREAASKAFTSIVQQNKDLPCDYLLKLKETTRGSNRETFYFICNRIKLDRPTNETMVNVTTGERKDYRSWHRNDIRMIIDINVCC